jgi:gamma-glutamyltranspeptidase/glutathione hydrolase
MSGRVAAGRRHTTGQSPTILIKDGRPVLIVGSAGEMRIISAVAQTIHRVVDRGMSLRDAVFAPRWHWEGPSLTYENRVAARELDLPKELVETLKGRGFSPRGMPASAHFGRVQAIFWDAKGETYTGVADPRGGGAARAVPDRRKRRRRTTRACLAAR